MCKGIRRWARSVPSVADHRLLHSPPAGRAREAPFQTVHSVSCFSVFPITWGICSSLDGQPQCLFQMAF